MEGREGGKEKEAENHVLPRIYFWLVTAFERFHSEGTSQLRDKSILVVQLNT